MQKRLFDNGWSDESKCHGCCKEEGTERHRLCHWPGLYEVSREIPEAFRKLEQKAKTSNKKMEMAKRHCDDPQIESQWNTCHFSKKKKRESEKHRKLGPPSRRVSRPCCHGRITGVLVVGQWCN